GPEALVLGTVRECSRAANLRGVSRPSETPVAMGERPRRSSSANPERIAMTARDDDITIRRAESPADYVACQDAQRRAWDLADESYVVPVATLVGANRHGGLVLGAF